MVHFVGKHRFEITGYIGEHSSGNEDLRPINANRAVLAGMVHFNDTSDGQGVARRETRLRF